MNNTQETTTEEKKTFAQLIEDLGDTPFTRGLKSWIEKHQMPIDEVVEWNIGCDVTDITEGDKVFKKYIAGPYQRVKLTFKDGTAKCGKSLYYSEWDINDDNEENWGYEWVRQKRKEDEACQ